MDTPRTADEYDKDLICGPCESSRINARGTMFCSTCQEIFCNDCYRLHRTKAWSQSHLCTRVNDMTEHDLAEIRDRKNASTMKNASPRRGSRWDRVRRQFLPEDNKNKYLTSHDHLKEDFDNEFFCVEHQAIVCELCKKNRHRSCKKIIPIPQAVSHIKRSKEPASLVASLRKYNICANEMVEDRTKQGEFLEKRKTELIPQISFVRKQVNQMFDELEHSVTLSLLNKHESNTNNINHAKEKCAGIQRATEGAMSDMRDVYSDGNISDSRYLKTVLSVRGKCPVYERCLKEAQDHLENKDYAFELDDKMKQLKGALKSITSLGTIKEIQLSPKTSPFLFTSKGAANVKDSTSLRKLSIVANGSEECAVCITSIQCLPSGDVLIVERNSSALELVDGSGELIMAHKFDSLPWDVALLSGTDVVVTVPGEKLMKILNINTRERKIVPKKDIHCRFECWGITCCDGKMYVTADPWKSTVAVRVLSYDGRELSSFKDNQFRNADLFKAPQHIACSNRQGEVYVSDSSRHAVTAFDLAGNMKYGYMSRNLGYPTGLAADFSGNVFVCAKETKNVHKIKSGFKEGKVVLTEKDGISTARGISVHPSENHILVADNVSGFIVPHKIK